MRYSEPNQPEELAAQENTEEKLRKEIEDLKIGVHELSAKQLEVRGPEVRSQKSELSTQHSTLGA